jgi:hypothetical protein
MLTGVISAEEAGLLRLHGVALAAQRHAVLRLALDAEIGGDVLGRLGHRVHAVQAPSCAC